MAITSAFGASVLASQPANVAPAGAGFFRRRSNASTLVSTNRMSAPPVSGFVLRASLVAQPVFS